MGSISCIPEISITKPTGRKIPALHEFPGIVSWSIRAGHRIPHHIHSGLVQDQRKRNEGEFVHEWFLLKFPILNFGIEKTTWKSCGRVRDVNCDMV